MLIYPKLKRKISRNKETFDVKHIFYLILRTEVSEVYKLPSVLQSKDIRSQTRMADKSNRGDNRLGQYKNIGKTEEDRRNRGREVTVELRKNKRDDTLSKKRQIEGITADSTDEEDLSKNLSTASLETIVEKARSADQATQLAAVQAKITLQLYCLLSIAFF